MRAFVTSVEDERVARLKAAIEVLDAYVAALDRRHEVLDSIFESKTAEDAEFAIGRLLGISREGAKAILKHATPAGHTIGQGASHRRPR